MNFITSGTIHLDSLITYRLSQVKRVFGMRIPHESLRDRGLQPQCRGSSLSRIPDREMEQLPVSLQPVNTSLLKTANVFAI